MSPGSAPEAAARLRSTLALATLVMLGLSWPLWVEGADFPRVPFVRGMPAPSAPLSWAAFGALGLALALASAGVAGRATVLVAAGLLAGFVLGDQHRFQPWAYQFLMIGVALAVLPPGRALGLARLWVVALYFHSALSKLDVSFCREMGPELLGAGLRPLGIDPGGWPPARRSAAALAMPAWELAVALGLMARASRPWALAGAVAQHGALILILGSFGLGHSPNVLVWNAALIAEDLILFRPGAGGAGLVEPDPRLGPAVRLAFVLAALLPFGERWGLWDSWPSFALYASHTERTEVLVRRDDAAEWPSAARRHLVPLGEGSWLRLDLTGWSRAVRGVPVYPQARACLGLAEALARRTPGGRAPRVVVWGRADRWTGRRDRREAEGRDAIRRLGDRFLLNAHPAPAG